MKNILSYKNPCFSGQEILDWANYQVNNKTSHYKQGLRVLNLFGNIKPDRKYYIFSNYRTWRSYCGYSIKPKLIIYRCKQIE